MGDLSRDASLDALVQSVENPCKDCEVGEPHMCPDLAPMTRPEGVTTSSEKSSDLASSSFTNSQQLSAEERDEQAVEHARDESVPIVAVRHVGPIIRCICGRDYVAGYRCAGDTRPKGAHR